MADIPDIEPFRKRLEELDADMAKPDFFSDQRRAATLSREHQHLSRLVELHGRYTKAISEKKDSESLLDDQDADEEMKALAQEEVKDLILTIEKLYHELIIAMLPPDESDSRNTIIEIRAGAGGDEASLFAGDLYRAYSRFAENTGWKIEHLGAHPSECGGYKEISFLITGDEVYKTLKFESGVHRVQRIPVTESGGRIHTSTVTVAVLPEAEEVDIDINPDDLEITVCRASGPGGQGVNTTDSAVQMTHKPSGITVYCADERSQLKNKHKALTVLRSRLLKQKQEEEQAKYSASRRSQIGSGDRSERIRTYNFPQSRLSDHRINFTAHNLPEVMEGEFAAIIEALQAADQTQRIEDLMKR